VTPTANQTN